MRNYIGVPLFLLFFSVFLIIQCSNLPSSDFYEVDGVLSIDPALAESVPNWEKTEYMNSLGVISKISHPDSSAALEFTFYISNPGRYSFWTLTANSHERLTSDNLHISITGPDGFLVNQFTLNTHREDRLKWTETSIADQESELLDFASEGRYTLSIHPGETEALQIHKIHMAIEDYLKPSGTGLPPSDSQEFNAAELQREKLVMLPPRWAFGVILGTVGTDQQTGELPGLMEHYSRRELDADAIWVDHDDQSNRMRADLPGFDDNFGTPVFGIRAVRTSECSSYADYFERGVKFIKIENSAGRDCLQEIFSEQLLHFEGIERGIVLKSISKLYEPESDQFPLPATAPYSLEWTKPGNLENGLYKPGGLNELLDDLANPHYSLYGTPFLSYPIDFSQREKLEPDLLLQSVQLLAFTPVMQMINFESVFSEDQETFIDESDLNQLKEVFALRKRLFPFHYSHAHETRQVNESLIQGFRDEPGQYLYGDAFLVAPITNPDSNGRMVFFPGNRLWYNYYTGEEYEGGRSWFVEASPDELQLFVKAGSVIPYLPEEVTLLKSVPDDYLKVEIYTGDAGTFRLVEDDGYTRDYRRAIAARTMFRYNEVSGQLKLTIGAVQKYFKGMGDQRSYDLHFMHSERPSEVTVNGEAIPESEQDSSRYWRYDDVNSELIIIIKEQSKYQKLDILITPNAADSE